MKGMTRFFALLLILIIPAGCTNMQLQDAFISEAGLIVTRDVAYGPEARHRLDIYRPESGPVKGTIVFVYGGSWTSGDKRLYKFMGVALANAGYVFVVPDYRYFPEVRFPGFVKDAARALAWVNTHIGAYGGQGTGFALMGHSAGAHIGALLLLDPAWLGAHGLSPAVIGAYVGLAGPYTFNPLEMASTQPIFETAPDIERVRPIKLVAEAARRGLPPMLLLHGSTDTTVNKRATEMFAEALRDAGVQVETHIYPRLAHIGVISSMVWALRWRAPVLSDVVAFLSHHAAS